MVRSVNIQQSTILDNCCIFDFRTFCLTKNFSSETGKDVFYIHNTLLSVFLKTIPRNAGTSTFGHSRVHFLDMGLNKKRKEL